MLRFQPWGRQNHSMARKTYYEILKVPPDAPRNAIRKAFRVRAAECHPDKVMHLDEEAQERARRKMTLLNEAYGVLGNETKRADYDEYLGLLAEKQARSQEGSSPGSTVPGSGTTPGTARPSGGTSPGSAATPVAPPAPDPQEAPPSSVPPPPPAPPPPPPELSQEELIEALEGAIRRVQGGILETNPQMSLTAYSQPRFDLCLHGECGPDAIQLYSCSMDRLEEASLHEFLGLVRQHSGATPLRHQRLYANLLVMCLKFSDKARVRRFVRDHNQAELATLRKSRGRTTMCGVLHIPTGELYFPYHRTILPDFRYLRDIACHY